MHDTRDSGRPPLNGWKEIASYLGKSARSVQRWEVTLDLPVHRLHTPAGQIVYANADEIDEWRRRLDETPVAEPEDPLDLESLPEAGPSPEPARAGAHPRSRYRPVVLAGMAVALFAAGVEVGVRATRPQPLAMDVRFAGRAIEGLNQRGDLVWSYQFDSEVHQPYSSDPPLVDIDDDGTAELLVPVRFAPRGVASTTTDALYCLGRDGRVKWSVRPDQQLTLPGRNMTAPWRIVDYAISTAAPRRIWVAFTHHTSGWSFVVEVNARGESRLRYVHDGALYTVAYWTTPSGGFLAAGGTSNEYKEAVLVLMSENDPSASFPPGPRSEGMCAECPAQTPRRFLLFPMAELTTANHDEYAWVSNLQTIGPSLKVAMNEGPGQVQAFVNPDFSLASLEFTQKYWGAHRDLELKGRLDHDVEHCPERQAVRTIREWTPAQGWREWVTLPGSRPRPISSTSK